MPPQRPWEFLLKAARTLREPAPGSDVCSKGKEGEELPTCPGEAGSPEAGPASTLRAVFLMQVAGRGRTRREAGSGGDATAVGPRMKRGLTEFDLFHYGE